MRIRCHQVFCTASSVPDTEDDWAQRANRVAAYARRLGFNVAQDADTSDDDRDEPSSLGPPVNADKR